MKLAEERDGIPRVMVIPPVFPVPNQMHTTDGTEPVGQDERTSR